VASIGKSVTIIYSCLIDRVKPLGDGQQHRVTTEIIIKCTDKPTVIIPV